MPVVLATSPSSVRSPGGSQGRPVEGKGDVARRCLLRAQPLLQAAGAVLEGQVEDGTRLDGVVQDAAGGAGGAGDLQGWPALAHH